MELITCTRHRLFVAYIITLYGRLWHKDVQTVLEEICGEVRRFRVWRIVCEDNADRGFLKDSLTKRGLWSKCYHESQNKRIKIMTYLRESWNRIVFLRGTDPEYIRQIMEYTEFAEHDDAPDSAATVCRYFTTWHWEAR